MVMDVGLRVGIGRSQSMSDHGVLQRPMSAGADKEIRIAVLGAQGVGKSALVVRYLTRRFIGEYSHQERVCVQHTVVDGKPTKLHILDTSGGDENREHLSWADGFLLVYSVADLQSFYTVSSLVDAIRGCRGSSNGSHSSMPPLLLVANKIDLPPEARKLSDLQGRRLASHLNCPYAETSAQENFAGVFQAFTTLIHDIRAQQKHDRLRKITKKSHSTISQLRETLRSLTDFRNRTNTF